MARQTRQSSAKKTKLKWWITGIVLVFIGIVVTQPQASAKTISSDEGNQVATYLSRSMKATGATPTGFLVNNWSQVNNQYDTLSTISDIGSGLARSMNMQHVKITTRNDTNEHLYEVDGVSQDGIAMRIVLSSFPETGGTGSGSTVLVVTGTGSAEHSVEELDSVYQTIYERISNCGIQPEMSACLNGKLNATIGNVHADTIVNEAFQAVQATAVEGLRSSTETSVSGYSSAGPTFIYTRGQRMNLQVAVHADTYEHCTNVLVGTPIITSTY